MALRFSALKGAMLDLRRLILCACACLAALAVPLAACADPDYEFATDTLAATAVVSGTLHTFTQNGTWTSGSPTVTVASTAGMLVGSTVTAPAGGIPAGSVIILISTPTTFVMNNAAVANASVQSITVGSRTVSGLSSNANLSPGQIVT